MERRKNLGDSMSPEPDNKRRRIRKGTTSCWDCKKRKVKCTFDAISDTECIACRRRGAPCISQYQPEEEFQAHSESNRGLLVDRIQRVETLLEQLLELSRASNKNISPVKPELPTRQEFGYFTPTSDYRQSNVFDTPAEEPPCPSAAISTSDMTDECRALSAELVKAFPSQEDIEVLCKSDVIATFCCHQIFTKAPDRPEEETLDIVNNLAKIPDPTTTPPVLVAKRMLLFALLLQYFGTQHILGLKESPSVVMDRLVDTAVRLVTTNEKIVACIGGLECIILEGVFQANGGSLRRAWIAFRKAMIIALLMKLDYPNPPLMKNCDKNSKTNPKFMWFRIVYMDSHLSLMLGLPHGGQQTNMENEVPGESPTCKLERAHTLIARRIIDRNRHDSFQDFATTKVLDRELLNAAKALPDRFWLPPDFENLKPNSREAFWEMMRLCNQLHHYNLVHLLHLPYLLRGGKEAGYHTYSKVTCVNASREIVNRYIAFRKMNGKLVNIHCRTSDFFALMAGMTILLAHIDNHRLEEEDWRAHQRLGDRAIVENLLDILRTVGKYTNDNLTANSASQLQRLLDFESDAARGIDYSAHNAVRRIEEQSGELQLAIPYFGIIKIGREGITKNGPYEADCLPVEPRDIPESVHAANHLFSATDFDNMVPLNAEASSFLPLSEVQTGGDSQMDLSSIASNDVYQQQLQYPALTASIHDWAFQGVDAAFFDNVMRGTDSWHQTL